jgi:hypothetical protein
MAPQVVERSVGTSWFVANDLRAEQHGGVESEGGNVPEPTTPVNAEIQCPTPTAHKRLHEGHRWWHGCLQSYDNPPEFQANLNAALQALRNVTWVLQKEHEYVPGFKDWYPQWQEKMVQDPLLKWLVKSRNRVVKSGDLEINSTARIRLVRSYFELADAFAAAMPDETEDVEIVKSVPPHTRPPEYVRYVAGLSPRALDGMALLVERRWVDKALPERELLDALAHCYGVLSELLADAHDRAGVAHLTTRASPTADARMEPVDTYRGRLPCMVTTLDVRTAQYRVSDGTLVKGERIVCRVPDNLPQKLLRRYSMPLDELLRPVEARSALDFVDPLFEHAKRVLAKDKFHSLIVVLCSGGTSVHTQSTILSDRASKYAFAQDLAKQVLMNGADGVVTIGELWKSRVSIDEDGLVIPPGENQDRQDVLEVYGEIADGSIRARHVVFRKRFGRIVFGEERVITESLHNNILAPTRNGWGSRSKDREKELEVEVAEEIRRRDSGDDRRL